MTNPHQHPAATTGTHRRLAYLIALFALLPTGLLIGLAVAGVLPASSAATPPPTLTAAPAPPALPHIGATLTIRSKADPTVRVTLDHYSNHTALNPYYHVPPGDREVAVTLTVKNIGARSLDDSAETDVSVVGANHASYGPGFWAVATCSPFPNGAIILNPAQSLSGCVSFEVPAHERIVKATYSSAGGSGGGLGVWTTNRAKRS